MERLGGFEKNSVLILRANNLRRSIFAKKFLSLFSNILCVFSSKVPINNGQSNPFPTDQPEYQFAVLVAQKESIVSQKTRLILGATTLDISLPDSPEIDELEVFRPMELRDASWSEDTISEVILSTH